MSMVPLPAIPGRKYRGRPGSIANASAVTTVVNNLVQGIYIFQLLVTNNSGATAADTVSVTVNAAILPPVANAGPSQTITLPNMRLRSMGRSLLLPVAASFPIHGLKYQDLPQPPSSMAPLQPRLFPLW